MTDTWTLAGRQWKSRIIVGTGKYANNAETTAALDASGAEIVTVALRRVDLKSGAPTVLDAIDRKIALHQQKRAVLEALFKALLHKLMTGEIDVNDLDLTALDALTAENEGNCA